MAIRSRPFTGIDCLLVMVMAVKVTAMNRATPIMIIIRRENIYQLITTSLRISMLSRDLPHPRATVERGVVCDHDGQTAFFLEQFVQIFKQSAAAGQYNSRIHDVGSQFRRGLFQGNAHGFHNSVNLLGDGYPHLFRVNGQDFGDTRNQIPSFDLNGFKMFRIRIGISDGGFDDLSGFSHQ